MMMKSNTIIRSMVSFSLVVCCLVMIQLPAISQPKKQSAYDKIFDKKRDILTSKGVITLHIVEGKLYFEVADSMLGKKFLMSSMVDNVSDLNLSYIGQRTSKPRLIMFTRNDSTVQIRLIPQTIITEKEDNINQAIANSSVPPIIYSTPRVAYTPDSLGTIFDVTQFFISDSKYIGTLNASSFGGFIQKVSSFTKDLSSVKSVEAYSNNASVISNMTYTFKTYFLGMESEGSEYLTAELRTSLRLIEDNDYKPRFADFRIGTSTTQIAKLSTKNQGSENSYYANRWNLYNGKKIIFYVDTLFLPTWRDAIKKGILKWNPVLEKAGFKNAIQVYDYPSNAENKEFSPSNIAYNCIRYAQIPSRGISRQTTVNPSTGEILGASIIFFRDSPVTLQRERIYQTALTEPGVRSADLPDSLMISSIELAFSREMAYCLGLSPNMAASSWMPTDSLRSKTFTAKEGITSSLTDQIRYNYVARPGDGAKLTADNPGVYDYYAIDWLYSIIPNATTPEDEVKYLRKKIESKSSDPRFYYGKEQNWGAYFDPRSIGEDLGDDKIKSAKYGIETLKYVASNGASWVNSDNTDESYRELFIDFIFLKLYDYYKSLMVNIGGIEIQDKMDTGYNDFNSWKSVPSKLQKESLIFMLNQADDMKWLDNKEMLKMSGMNSSFSKYISGNLVSLVFQRIPYVEFSQSLTKNLTTYSLDQVLTDIRTFSLKNLKNGVDASSAQMSTLYMLVKTMVDGSSLPEVSKVKERLKSQQSIFIYDGKYSTEEILKRCYSSNLLINDDDLAEKSGFEPLTSIKYLMKIDNSPTYYKHLLILNDDLNSCLKIARSEETREKLTYLIQTINTALKNK